MKRSPSAQRSRTSLGRPRVASSALVCLGAASSAVLMACSGGSSGGGGVVAPAIQSFSRPAGAVSVGDQVLFSWELVGLDGATTRCVLDVDTSDGVEEYELLGCTGAGSQAHTFRNGGTQEVRLAVWDAGVLVTEQLLGVDVAGPRIELRTPLVDALSGEQLEVRLDASAVAAVVEVSAHVGAASSQLVLEETTQGVQRFAGAVDLSALAEGDQELEVRLLDDAGVTVSVVRPFSFDRPPSLSLIRPVAEAVATPLLELEAECADALSDACSLVVEALRPGFPDEVVASGDDAIATMLDLTGFDGGAVTLRVTARDEMGQETVENQVVFVEASPMLAETERLEGTVLDADDERVLYLVDNALRVRSRADGSEVDVPLAPSVRVRRDARLSSFGALFVDEVDGGVYSWSAEDSGELEPLRIGRADPVDSVRFAGNYAIWSEDGMLYRHFTLAPATDLVASDVVPIGSDVTRSGVVVFAKGPDVFRWTLGVTKNFTMDPVATNDQPTFDGSNVVCRQTEGDGFRIVYGDGSGTEALTTYSDDEVRKDDDYRARGGWIAFTREEGEGLRQVWLRRPGGPPRQLASFDTSCVIEGLSASGEVVFRTGGRRYLGSPLGTLFEVGSDLGEVELVAGRWAVRLGGSLFALRL